VSYANFRILESTQQGLPEHLAERVYAHLRNPFRKSIANNNRAVYGSSGYNDDILKRGR